MKQISRRRKGKKLQKILQDKLLHTFDFLKPSEIRMAMTGENGADVKLGKVARRVIPYQFECKNQQKFKTLYAFFKQAKRHGKLEPVLVCKMNGEKPVVVIDFEHFFELIKIS